MKQIYMTKDDKIDLIERIGSVSSKVDSLENKLMLKMEVNFRWLVGITLTGIATTATIIKLIS